MQPIAVITGAGSGLGKALANCLAQYGIKLYLIDKLLDGLQETQQITPIIADVSTIKGRHHIGKVLRNLEISYLVHNAAIVYPIMPLPQITLREFRKIQATNVEGPLFLTQLLLPQLIKNARILHISSDCAHYPFAHWIPYCTSKAALFMAYQCLKKELSAREIHIGSIDPGLMDTPMQQYICDDAIQFPEKIPLAQLQQEGILVSPMHCAQKCMKLLLNIPNEFFSAKEWLAKEL